MKMTKAMLPAGTESDLGERLIKAYDQFDSDASAFSSTEVGKNTNVFKVEETPQNKMKRMEVMKACLQPYTEMVKANMAKSSISTTSNIVPYDLRAPALHLVPWLSPIRESLPRVKRPSPGTMAHWKAIIANSTSYSRGGAPACPWINEGQRAPLISVTALNASASYASIGRDGSVTYEAESASQGFEDALAAGHFFSMETLMVLEEDALIGGNFSLTLGTANKPVGSISGTGSFTGGPYYAAVIGMTYEGYRNYVMANGLNSSTGTPIIPASPSGITQQSSIVTSDSKTMTVNWGVGQASAISTTTASPSSSVSATFTTTAKTGEIAWAWFIGTSNATSGLYLQAITTVPSYSFTAAPGTTGQLLSSLTAADYSANNGSLGGGSNQVAAFDGLLTQAFNNTTLSPQNAYVANLAGATLTTGGAGNVVEIDTMLLSMWNLYKITVDVIYVNAQELKNITARVLNGASAPLLRVLGDAEGFDVTGFGVISFYHNPYIPGGRKIPIMVHPTVPPGTILAYAKNLPAYFKSNATPSVAEVLTRRDYYSKEWADTTREYQFGIYAEECLAVYAPFCLGIICGVGNG